MTFVVDERLLAGCSAALSGRRLLWVVGGAGSGKTTVCRAVSDASGIPVYDMDAGIYGSYHGRFTVSRHPANSAWSSEPNGLGWLLGMTWEEFDAFNRAALVEYLDLLAADLADADPTQPLLVDGGVCNPALLARAIPPQRIVCMSGPERSSAEIWSQEGERAEMKAMVMGLPFGEQAWERFLEFDERITSTIREECVLTGVATCAWSAGESVDCVARRRAELFAMPTRPPL